MKRLACLALLALTAACGSNSPTGPSQPAIPNFGFNWTGTFRVDSCAPFQGTDPSICAPVTIGQLDSFSMTLAQSGSQVTGPFTIGQVAFPSTGAAVTDGTLTLQASTLAVDGTTTSSRWVLTVTGGQLAGSVSSSISNTSGGVTLTGTITSATHQ